MVNLGVIQKMAITGCSFVLKLAQGYIVSVVLCSVTVVGGEEDPAAVALRSPVLFDKLLMAAFPSVWI